MDTDDDRCPADIPETDARDDDDPPQRDGRREADLPLMIYFCLSPSLARALSAERERGQRAKSTKGWTSSASLQ